MTLTALLTELESLPVSFWLEAGELRSKAPKGVLTASQREALREHRAELRDLCRLLLAGEPAPAAALQGVLERRDLMALADVIGQRMVKLSAVPANQWTKFRTQLCEDDDRLGAGMKRWGLTLEELGWTVAGPGCRWRRVAEQGGNYDE